MLENNNLEALFYVAPCDRTSPLYMSTIGAGGDAMLPISKSECHLLPYARSSDLPWPLSNMDMFTTD